MEDLSREPRFEAGAVEEVFAEIYWKDGVGSRVHTATQAVRQDALCGLDVKGHRLWKQPLRVPQADGASAEMD